MGQDTSPTNDINSISHEMNILHANGKYSDAIELGKNYLEEIPSRSDINYVILNSMIGGPNAYVPIMVRDTHTGPIVQIETLAICVSCFVSIGHMKGKRTEKTRSVIYALLMRESKQDLHSQTNG